MVVLGGRRAGEARRAALKPIECAPSERFPVVDVDLAADIIRSGGRQKP